MYRVALWKKVYIEALDEGGQFKAAVKYGAVYRINQS